MSLNVLLSLSLAWRVLDLRRRLPSTMEHESKDLYANFEALLTESALIYGLVSLIFMVLYGLDNPGANLFTSLVVQLEVRRDPSIKVSHSDDHTSSASRLS